MATPAEVPIWAMTASQPFRYAPAPVRRAAGAAGINAKWFSQRSTNAPLKVEAVFWSSRRFGRVEYERRR